MASRQSISSFEVMYVRFGTSLLYPNSDWPIKQSIYFGSLLCIIHLFVFGLLSTIFLNIVHLVAGVSSKNFTKVLLLFQIPKDTVFSCAGAPLSNVRVAFLKTLLFFKSSAKLVV